MKLNRITVFIISFTFLTGLFAQNNTTDELYGKWAKDSGFSDFFLEIDNSEILYIDKSSEKTVRFSYHLQQGNYGTDLEIKIDGYFNDNTLELSKLYSDFSRSVNFAQIPFKFEKDVLHLYLINKKNEWSEYKMIPFEKKDATVSKWKNIGKKALEGGVEVTKVAIAADLVDDSLDNVKMQSIADKCLKASRNASGY